MSTVSASTTPCGSATRLHCRSRRRCGIHRSGASSRASYSGAGGPPGRPGGGGLILPGQDDFPADWAQQQQGVGRPTPPGRPGGGPRGQPGFGPSGGPSVTPRDGPLYQPFRPPAAYKDAATLGKDELVNKLRARAGRWFDLAKAIDALHAIGVQNTDIFELTGITMVVQNAWKVQAAVYFSLVADDTFPKELLAFFNTEENATTLTELRSVPATWRSATAMFVAQRGLDLEATRELGRAVVDADRGRPPADAWDRTPGDALAAKIWRDAGEVQRRGDWQTRITEIVERGLNVATSETAKARLRERLTETTASSAAPGVAAVGSAGASAAVVQVFRLESEESAFRPVCLLGGLDDVTPSAVRSAPVVGVEGVFNVFKLPPGGAGISWVALPAWAKIALRPGLFTLSVIDTKQLTVVPQLSSTPGPALLVFDRDAVDTIDATSYYLVSKASSLLVDAGGKSTLQRMELQPGGKVTRGGAAGVQVCARLLIACRPPLPRSQDMESGRDLSKFDAAFETEQGKRPLFGADAMEVLLEEDEA